MTQNAKIIYTKTDEAPALATRSFLPIVKAFAEPSGIEFITKDISLAGRILSLFPEYLSENQRVSDDLAELGQLVKKPEANIIKLPNISASIPQLTATIKELQADGFPIPDYPEEPKDEKEKEIQARYNKVKGSAVNPVLREGNSDRRAPKAVKEFAKKNPHSMGAWSSDSESHVAHMTSGDFRNNEQSVTIKKDCTADIILEGNDGSTTVLKSGLALLEGEIVDATYMNKKALIDFLEIQKEDAKKSGVLFSLHMKATMMKVSDPIIFGHAVKVFFADVFEKHGAALEAAGVDVNNGFGDLLKKIDSLPNKEEILADIQTCYENGPDLAMVNSDKGITNLHVPSDVIIDASMPAMIRNSGQMWNKDGKSQDTKAVIPDSSYAKIYSATIDFCKKNGAFDPTKMGSVSNVGLMAQKAEEYGSHDKTFEISKAGTVVIKDNEGNTLTSHTVEEGDIWRACQVKDLPIQDWIKLAVKRARATGNTAVFWLDKDRAHDAELIKKINQYLPEHDTDGLEILIKDPEAAAYYSCEEIHKGIDVISVTGNVLRDYNTDLFPILEVGTSAKMLSIVPLMNGGGLFETGAGGSAPKHVQQFVEENHLRWDSLGEFLALAVSLEHYAEVNGNEKAAILGETLDNATTTLLMNGKSPSRKAGELDNRGSHYYLALYWAKELAAQDKDAELKLRFAEVASKLEANEAKIVEELNSIQGNPVDIGGYYSPDDSKADPAMRPSTTLNEILDAIVAMA